VTDKNNARVYKMAFASVYPLYITKVEKKGRTQAELDQVISWLTGYQTADLQKHLEQKTSFEAFFMQANMHPNTHKITGMICGYRIENIPDPIIQKVRCLDKLVDELAKGRSMEKILRP
jgi:hypothetical protein